MIEVYWLEQTEADVPAHNNWLSAAEIVRVKTMLFPKRRADWLLGRWTAKQALSAYTKLPVTSETLASIELRPAKSGAPEPFIGSERAAVSISMSHRDDRAVCAVGEPAAKLGVDLELIEARTDAFAADYFTAEENAAIQQAPIEDRPRLVTLIWSAKESALKALGTGLRADTRSVTVVAQNALLSCLVENWHPLLVHRNDSETFHGWWQSGDEFVRTLLADPAPFPPIALKATKLADSVRRIA